MIKKRLIGLFLMLVFLVPVMPIMQVGAMLSQGQMTEEIADQPSDSVSKFNEADTHGHSIGFSKSDVVSLYIKRENDEHFLSRQADDIQTPPPNSAS